MTIEHKKVLITGNGFDLSFGLPTAYKDFVDAMHRLQDAVKNKDDLSKYPLNKLLPEKCAGSAATVDFSLLAQPISAKNVPGRMPLDNIWINYFVQRLDKMPTTARWVDFEAEIREVLKALTKLSEKEKEYTEKKGGHTFEMVVPTDVNMLNAIMLEGVPLEVLKNIGVLRDYVDGASSYVAQNPLEKIQPTTESGFAIHDTRRVYRAQKKSISDLKIIDALNSQLAELCSIFTYFLKQTLEPIYAEKLNTVDKTFFENFDEAYTFNYTDTLERVQESLVGKVKHLHGDLTVSEANLSGILGHGEKVVLGVDNADDFVELLGTEVLSLTKYFQTLFKKTDAHSLAINEMHEIISDSSGKEVGVFNHDDKTNTLLLPLHLHIWGHSLDLSDRKYISRIFELMWKKDGAKNDNKITIYYYDEASRASLLRNILDARMLGGDGKEKIDLLVYQGRLTFEPNPPVFKEANPDAKP